MNEKRTDGGRSLIFLSFPSVPGVVLAASQVRDGAYLPSPVSLVRARPARLHLPCRRAATSPEIRHIAHAQPASTSQILLSSRPPLPVPIHDAAGADGDLLELNVLWPATLSAVGLDLLAALPEDEGKKKKKRAVTGGGDGGGLSPSLLFLHHPPETSQSKRATHSGVSVDLGGAPAWPPGTETGPISFTTGDFPLGAQANAAGAEEDRDYVMA